MITAAALALLSVPGAAAGGVPASATIAYAQLVIRERVIVRVPASRAPPTIRWKAKRAPRCISAEGLAGAAVMTPDSIDLIQRGGARTRAELEDACPALDFYKGFYLTPAPDKQICAGRDAIHARSGGECQIQRFRKLVPDD